MAVAQGRLASSTVEGWNRACPKAPIVRNLLPVGLFSWGLQRMARGPERYGALSFPIAQTVQGIDHVSLEWRCELLAG